MDQISTAKVDILRNLNFEQNYFQNAVRKTNVRSKIEFNQIQQERNTLSPEKIGAFSRRISIQSNLNKTFQERFFEMYA